MAANYVGFHHIHALLSALRAPTLPGTFNREHSMFYFFEPTIGRMVGYDLSDAENLSTLGRLLLRENVRSLTSRYGTADDMLGGESPDLYVFAATRTDKLTPEVCIKALNSYEYQACESADWRASIAYQIVCAMKDAFLRRIPAVRDAAGWSLEDLAPMAPKPIPAPLLASIRTRKRRTVSRRLEAI